MKKQLSFALLTISIFSLNILPAKAIDNTANLNVLEAQSESKVTNDGQWCVAIPYMGLFCWVL